MRKLIIAIVSVAVLVGSCAPASASNHTHFKVAHSNLLSGIWQAHVISCTNIYNIKPQVFDYDVPPLSQEKVTGEYFYASLMQYPNFSVAEERQYINNQTIVIREKIGLCQVPH